MAYLAAETQFSKGNFEGALKGFNNYLISYPNGYFALPAHFYRAECFYRNNEFDKAALDYDFVTAQPISRFTEKRYQDKRWLFINNKTTQKLMNCLKSIRNSLPLMMRKEKPF
ncbi:MAG: hypothetical protein IPN93_04325 [Bacteroidetes bacterium]|nr:hypothetical protein [Bacteroidota bacterium]